MVGVKRLLRKVVRVSKWLQEIVRVLICVVVVREAAAEVCR